MGWVESCVIDRMVINPRVMPALRACVHPTASLKALPSTTRWARLRRLTHWFSFRVGERPVDVMPRVLAAFNLACGPEAVVLVLNSHQLPADMSFAAAQRFLAPRERTLVLGLAAHPQQGTT